MQLLKIKITCGMKEGKNLKQKVYTKDIKLVLLASFCYMSCPTLIAPIITGYTGSIGGSGFIMGIIGGGMNFCALLFRPVAGNLVDKMSKFKISFFGASLLLLASIGYIVAPGTSFLIIVRIINGIGYACCSVALSTWMSDMLPENKIGSGMGLYGTMQALALGIAPTIGINIKKFIGYWGSFAVAAIFALLTMIIILFIKNKGLVEKKETRNFGSFTIIDKKVLPVAIILMLFTIPYSATQAFLATYVEEKNIAIAVGLFFPVYAIVLIALRLGLRNYFDKLSYKFFVYFSVLSSVASVLLLNTMQGYFVMILSAIFMAGGYGIMCSVSQSTAIRMAGRGKRGVANSTYYVGLDLGLAFGPMIGGIIYGKMSFTFFYPILLICAPLCIGILFIYKKNFYGLRNSA